MRVDDRPLPTFVPVEPEHLPWATQIHLLIEAQTLAERWDDPGIFWDDPRLIWDQAELTGDLTDVACDLAGIDVEHGPADGNELYPSGSIAATLVDPDGRYQRFNPDGTLLSWQIGKRIAVVARSPEDEWSWIFFGRVTSWSALSRDGTVEIEAFNLPHELDSIGKFTPGANGQNVAQRIAAILGASHALGTLTDLDAGDVTLTAQETERSPWEEIQTVATFSDGGIVFADADDTLRYFDRRWREGRDDQTKIWELSDNACDAEIIAWDTRLLTSDERLSTAVRLTNVAGLVADEELSTNPYQVAHVLVYPEPGQWTTQSQGDSLAHWLLDRSSTLIVDVDELTLYVHDVAQNLFPFARDVRLGDQIVFRHEYPIADGTTGELVVSAIVNMIRHSINANEWLLGLGASTFPYFPPAHWDVSRWDVDYWKDAS